MHAVRGSWQILVLIDLPAGPLSDVDASARQEGENLKYDPEEKNHTRVGWLGSGCVVSQARQIAAWLRAKMNAIRAFPQDVHA